MSALFGAKLRAPDAGATRSGRPHFVMECIEGTPILERCNRERLDTWVRHEQFSSVVHAVQHAIQHPQLEHLIRRDIEPDEAMLQLQGSVSVPKGIDFGTDEATNSELTRKTLFDEHQSVFGARGPSPPTRVADQAGG